VDIDRTGERVVICGGSRGIGIGWGDTGVIKKRHPGISATE
jgi:hypothetical protein